MHVESKVSWRLSGYDLSAFLRSTTYYHHYNGIFPCSRCLVSRAVSPLLLLLLAMHVSEELGTYQQQSILLYIHPPGSPVRQYQVSHQDLPS